MDQATDLPTDPRGRLVRLRWMFHKKCEHHVTRHAATKYLGPGISYAGSGLGHRPYPTGDEPIYDQHLVVGRGDTAIEAIDDWYARLPEGEFDTVVWRGDPEIVCNYSFDEKKNLHLVISRMAVVPKVCDFV